MLRLLAFAISFLLLTSLVHASDVFSYGDLEEIHFSNRASCAKDSKKPSKSSYILLSNVDIAKSVYRLALFRGDDVEVVTKQGIDRFRYSVLSLISIIHKRMIEGKLPLLPANLAQSDKEELTKYRKVLDLCQPGAACPAHDGYLRDIWKIAATAPNSESARTLLKSIDNFSEASSFFPSDRLEDRNNDQLQCRYLKKFGALHAQLYGTKPTREAIAQIGSAAESVVQSYAECTDLKAQENLQVSPFLIEFPKLKPKQVFRKDTWEEFGFDYWHSLKTYLSYAFRFAPELDAMAFPFAPLFRGVAIEESIMLVSDNCRSLAPAECDGDRLALNSIRELAKNDFVRTANQSDILSRVSTGPANDLVEDMIPSVNTDILDLSYHESSSAWLENFSGQLSRSRALVKNRLIKAINHFNFVARSLPVQKLVSELDNQFSKILFANSNNALNEFQKRELYYLCSEFSYSQHETWSFLRGQLDVLAQAETLRGLTSQISNFDSKKAYEYFTLLGDKINKACYDLEQKEIWSEDFELDRTGFAPWYIEKVYESKFRSNQDDQIKEYLKDSAPMLAFSNYGRTNDVDDVLCAHASDCARKAIESVLSIYNATQYAAAFWNLDNEIDSPDLFNPYSERVACKVYDPWFKMRATLTRFVWDMGQAAASAFVPGMIYTSLDLQPRTVTSFDQLVRDGKLEFDPNFTRQSIMMAVTADFGPLTGVPCAVSVNRSHGNPLAPVRFTGISVGACSSRQDHNIDVQSASSIDPNSSTGSSECISCALNFESISGVVAQVTSNVGPVFFIARGIYNLFKGLSDPFNIPRSWSVHPYNALETLKLYGEIPKKCVSSLRSGGSCLNECESTVSKRVRETLGGYISKFSIDDDGQGYVLNSKCSHPIKVDADIEYSSGRRREKYCSQVKLAIPRSCLGGQ